MHPHLAQFKFLVLVIVPKARPNAFIEQAIALRTSVQNERPRFCNAQPTSVVPNAAALEAVPMGKCRIKPNYRPRVLRLPDLDHCRLAVLNSVGSPASRRVYEYAINQFIAWYCSEPRLALNRIVVVCYRMHLESRGLAANTINQQLAAVRRLAHEAADSGLLSPECSCGNQPSERGQAAWVPLRQLVERRSEFRSAQTCLWR